MKSAFDHEDLRVYQAAIEFVVWHEKVARALTTKAAACDHLHRASASVPVNIAQASGKRSMSDRRQFIDTAYGSSLECAACLDVLSIQEHLHVATTQAGKERLSKLVAMLIGFRKATDRALREERPAYRIAEPDGMRVWFDHEKLDVYRKALEFVAWCSRLCRNDNMPHATQAALDRSSTGVALTIAEGNGKFSSKDRCRFIGHARTAALQAAATLDIHAIRQVRSKQATIDGKKQLADIVHMLVAWETKLKDA
jgi:four helix bundle protein